MSKLDELITKLCPNGVEYKTISSMATVLRGKRLTKNQLFAESKYPVYHGGLEPLGYYNESNRSANTVMVINVGASAGTVGYSPVEFWSSDGCFCISHSKEFINKYLYYAVLCQEAFLKSRVRVAGIPTLDNSVLEKLKVPVPPLEVQEEIVRILDMFTQLTARKKQYEYYRDTLLTFDENDKSVKFVKLNDIAQYSADRIEASLLDENSYVGVDNLLPNKQGKTLSNYVPTEGRLTKFIEGDILIGNIRPYLRKVWISDIVGGTNGDVLTIHINNQNEVYPKYLYYILSSEAFFHYDTQNSKGAKMPRGDKSMVMKYELPLPSFSEQQRIVSILDRFDALCNDITVGLPAEIEARKKQYEYYRDKLLTFKEKVAS
ncbi:MAG: restriction endonuclease subunit S [Spirochaetales bacterium]|nr:restriction endonuclease subunit S [Spirochaetales bacterium]